MSHPSLAVGTPLSLQAVIGISDQQVSAEARATLRALSVFPPKPNTFSEASACVVSAMPVETLDVLADAGLLESSGPERYTLHQTIADYAQAHLTDTSVAERLATYFVAYVKAHTEDYTALERENGNILAALEAAFERGMQTEFVQGCACLRPFLDHTWTLCSCRISAPTLSWRPRVMLKDDAGQTMAWLHLGKVAAQRGNYPQAQEYWHHGLQLAHQSGQRSNMAQILRELGELAWRQGQLEQAHQFLGRRHWIHCGNAVSKAGRLIH